VDRSRLRAAAALGDRVDMSIALSYSMYETPSWKWCPDCARAGTGGRCAQHLTLTFVIPAITVTTEINYPTEIVPSPREPWK
jgi:hypothetical protein